MTYLKLQLCESQIGISSMTPSGQWLAMRAVFWNSGHRRKSDSMRVAIPSMQARMPIDLTSRAAAEALR